MALRVSVQDFNLANPLYVGATVTFYTVDGNGAKTTTKATLYDGATGTGTLTNPQTLDSDGRFSQAVYIEEPVVARVSGLTVDDHDTGIIAVIGRWRGTWTTATVYYGGEFVVAASDSNNVYQITGTHTSGTFATDVANGKLTKVIDVAAIVTAATAGSTRVAAAAAGGTANALTATFDPTILPLADKQLVLVVAAAANTTTTPTFAPDGDTAQTITKFGGSALAVGDIKGAGHRLLMAWDETNTRWELLNGASLSGLVSTFILTLLDDADAATALATLGALATNGNGGSLTGTTYDMPFSGGYDSDGVKQDLAVQVYYKFRVGHACTITGGYGGLETAATGQALIVDILKNGTTIFTTKPQFGAGSTSLTAGVLKTDGTETFAAGDLVTFSVTQVGSGTVGQGLTYTAVAAKT